MDDRLATLYLLPPPASTSWAGTPGQTIQSTIVRQKRDPLTLDLPLFWYDPRWCELPTSQADDLAVAVSRHNILVSALRSDLSGPDVKTDFHAPQSAADSDSKGENADDKAESTTEEPTYFPRIVPYRPERYGLSPKDFDHATIIDVRLMMPRDTSGRFAYSPEQIARWESKNPSDAETDGSWVPAATFPPDVDSFEKLSSKLNQLRQLAPSAAVFTSIGPFRLEQEVPLAVAAKPDGLIVRLDQVALEPLQLAALTRRARQLINDANGKKVPLWIVPGEITADDAVKLVALGADAIGIDAWCNPLLDVPDTGRSHYSSSVDFDDLADDALTERLERFSGLYLSLQRVPVKERLGSFSATWARTLAVRALR
ncbi:MAG: hypothetical protein HKN47_06070 [Pirellulaceae bacterium]|nr:hypothetical protein [Pirellulaceae bacterium]